jgi:hypothetical protein
MKPAHPTPLFALTRTGAQAISNASSLAESPRICAALLFNLMKQFAAPRLIVSSKNLFAKEGKCDVFLIRRQVGNGFML